MPTPLLDPAECQRVLDVHTANARRHAKTYAELGKEPTWVTRRLQRAKKIGLYPSPEASAQGARLGYAPENDLTHTVPDGYMLKGASTLYDADGTLKLQWVKSQVDYERQMEMFKEAVAEMAVSLP